MRTGVRCQLLILVFLAARAAGAEPPELVWTLEGHQAMVACVAFSPDGQTLASGGGYTDGTICFWNPETGDLKRAIRGTKESVSSLAFSPDGKLLASGSSDSLVRLFDPATGELRRVLRGHKGGVNCVAFSPDGKWLASACDADEAVRLWNAQTGEVVFGGTIRWGGHSVAFTPDGKTLAGGGRFGTLTMWSVPSGSQQRLTHVGKGKVTVAYSPDGSVSARSSDSTDVGLYDMHKLRPLPSLKDCGRNSPLAFSPDSALVATASAGTAAYLWDAHTGVLKHAFSGHRRAASSLAFSPDGRLLATGSSDNTVKLWDVSQWTKKENQASK